MYTCLLNDSYLLGLYIWLMMAVAVLAHKFISAIDRWRSIGKRDPLMRLANRKDAHRPTKIDDLFIRSDDIFIRFIVFRVRHSIKIVQFTFSSRIIVSCPLFFCVRVFLHHPHGAVIASLFGRRMSYFWLYRAYYLTYPSMGINSAAG